MLAIFTMVMCVVLAIVACQRRCGGRHSSLRAIKPRQTPKAKKNKEAYGKGSGRESLVANSNWKGDGANGPSQKVDSSVVDNEMSCITSTAPLTTTITELDTECATTYIAPDARWLRLCDVSAFSAERNFAKFGRGARTQPWPWSLQVRLGIMNYAVSCYVVTVRLELTTPSLRNDGRRYADVAPAKGAQQIISATASVCKISSNSSSSSRGHR